ncbi:MAG: hypothetical protein PHY09_00885 [Desulfuromonadaceae bacterium]|nr:hypothetical protein [Desulfuromonadaceae bacterium]MDD5104870.1 hypothetical protein [Desulfuromonadaceae bacterium]
MRDLREATATWTEDSPAAYYIEDPLAVALVAALDAAERRRDALAGQLESAGSELLCDQVGKYNLIAAEILNLLAEIYTLDVANVYMWQHRGFCGPRFVRNASGVEDTEGASQAIAEMAAARGQTWVFGSTRPVRYEIDRHGWNEWWNERLAAIMASCEKSANE